MKDMMEEHFRAQLWTQFATILLGLWLVAAPVTLGYLHEGGQASSDMAAGIALVLLATLSLSYTRGWARWGVTAVGLWLLFAPLMFWTKSAAAYANDTLVAMLVISFSILVPGMPGMRMMHGPTVPPGWSYNPSSWAQRGPIVALAFVSLLASRYLAAYQLEHLATAWDPFFGAGTARVLLSDVSKMFPISDAGLGATAYAIELLSTLMGGPDRWRTMPWMVLMFGILVIPLGVASIILVVLQPVVVGQWCTICLFTALTMLVMIPLAADEVVAMMQFMADVRRRGDSLWTNFWHGGTMEGGEEEDRSAPTWPANANELGRAGARGVTVTWRLLVCAAVGLVVMAAPGLLRLDTGIASHFWIVGPLITTVSVVAWADVLRAVRFVNLVLALWLAAAPIALPAGTSALAAGILLAVAVSFLTLRRGSIRESYAGWNERIL